METGSAKQQALMSAGPRRNSGHYREHAGAPVANMDPSDPRTDAELRIKSEAGQFFYEPFTWRGKCRFTAEPKGFAAQPSSGPTPRASLSAVDRKSCRQRASPAR